MTDLALRWREWARRWDDQQGVYIEQRERLFDVLTELIRSLAGDAPYALDLAAGTGAVSTRLIDRLPGARCVALDADPVLLALGQRAYGDCEGRLRWHRADLRTQDWAHALGDARFDVIVSTTALHWLSPDKLAAVYRQAFELLAPGGVMLNGDYLPLPASTPRLRAVLKAEDERRQAAAIARGAEAWSTWWDELREESELATHFEERDHLYPPGSRDGESPTLAFHEAALHEAGFEEVAVVWQDLEERILVAIPPDLRIV